MDIDKKIKVAHIITRLDKGGSAENTLLTSIGLEKSGYDVTLVSGSVFTPKDEFLKDAKRVGVNFFIISGLVRPVNPFKDIIAFFGIFNLIKREKFDIVHTHSSKAGILGRLAAKLSGVSIIIHTPHGHIFYGYFNRFLTRLFIYIERFTAKFTTKIITLTDRGADEHVKFKIAPSDRFVTIHSGIRVCSDALKLNDLRKGRVALGIPLESFLIGAIGRFVPVKGHKYLIEAMKSFLKVRPEAFLLLAGEGCLKEKLKKQAQKLKIADKVKFLGYKDDLDSIFPMLDLFVLPSLNEGMGRVLAQAMIWELPIIATKVGGIPDLCINEFSALLVGPGDSKGLLEAMIRLANDKVFSEKLGKKAKNKIKDEFSEERMVEQTDKLYSNLLRQRKDK